jgi:hypothetical protein
MKNPSIHDEFANKHHQEVSDCVSIRVVRPLRMTILDFQDI